MIITLQLEQRFSKEQIFEDYANEVDLGWRGTFNIRGFGEAAEIYLGKDLSQINLPEAAELAGMIQRPGIFDPYRHPDRTRERRNVILRLMRENGFINDRDYALACDTPLNVAKGAVQSLEAPYFVDLVNDSLQSTFQDADVENTGLRVYTTLDLSLQRDAADAIRAGMEAGGPADQAAAPFPRPEAARGAGGAGGDRPAYRRSQGAGRRPQLRREPAQPRAGQAPAGLDFQAVRLCRGHGHGCGRRLAHSHAQHHGDGSSRPRSGSTASPTRPAISSTSFTAT